MEPGHTLVTEVIADVRAEKPALRFCTEEGLVADSDDVDQSFRSDADQFGAKRRRALSV